MCVGGFLGALHFPALSTAGEAAGGATLLRHASFVRVCVGGWPATPRAWEFSLERSASLLLRRASRSGS